MPALIHHRRTNPLGTPSLPAHSRDLRTSHCRHFQPPDFALKIFKLSFSGGLHLYLSWLWNCYHA